MKHLIYEKGGIIEQWEKGRSLQHNTGQLNIHIEKKTLTFTLHHKHITLDFFQL